MMTGGNSQHLIFLVIVSVSLSLFNCLSLELLPCKPAGQPYCGGGSLSVGNPNPLIKGIGGVQGRGGNTVFRFFPFRGARERDEKA